MDYKIDDTAFKLAEFAAQAMIYEVSCYPSPGLVSPVSNGAHDDMNYYTFINSTCALIKYFTLISEEGLKADKSSELFESVRKIGKLGEKDMFIKTKGVNTHKGMLFLLGMACAASGRAIKDQRGFYDIQDIIKDMASGIVERELSNLTENVKKNDDLSYGEKLYLKYKVTGVRGEVEKGMPTVFDFSLGFYESCSELDTNDRLIHTLIGIMQKCEDTNIIHRHSYDILLKVQKRAKNIIAAGGMKTSKGRKMVDTLCIDFQKERISPGGSADILGVTVFELVKDYFGNYFGTHLHN